jgi:gliding motility-associated-like protein
LQGCRNADTIVVGVFRPFKLSTSPNDTLCIGESINLLATGTDRYTWSPNNGLNSSSIANPVASPGSTTNYQVIGTDSLNCFSDTGSVRVTVYPIPVFDINEENLVLTVGNNVQLTTTSSPDVIQWRWLPPSGLSCINCPNPVAAPQITTTYTAQAINEGGCKAEDKVTVTVVCNNANIFIPNTFSPNDDGMNDVFYPRGKGIASVKALTIFNRWGNVVFQKLNFNMNDAQAGWNGSFNGTKLPPDVYVYSIDIVCENNQIFSLKGNITLIK